MKNNPVRNHAMIVQQLKVYVSFLWFSACLCEQVSICLGDHFTSRVNPLEMLKLPRGKIWHHDQWQAVSVYSALQLSVVRKVL